MSQSNLYGHVLCAVDLETTGTEPGFHEVIQVAAVPLDQHLEPSKKYRPFYLDGIAPDHPERQSPDAKAKTKLDAKKLAEECVSQTRAADLMDEWFMSLALPADKRLVPLAHNWGFERSFMLPWLGPDTFHTIWDGRARDSMQGSALINDIHWWQGNKDPFTEISLTSVCKRLGIPLENAHNALADCLATAKVYKALLSLFG
jgi:DNA polymerase III epsilon subunit-like protein